MRVTDVNVTPTDDHDAVVLDLEMSQRYQHPLGRSSPFFTGLDQHKLLATSCQNCPATFFPPRDRCPTDGGPTSWYELAGTGRVVAATVVHSPPPFGGIEAPYVLASIRLDGVDGGLTHRLLGSDPLPAGSPVSARFLDGPQAHPLLSLAFAADPGPESGEGATPGTEERP